MNFINVSYSEEMFSLRVLPTQKASNFKVITVLIYSLIDEFYKDISLKRKVFPCLTSTHTKLQL